MKINVIIPVYNEEKIISDTIDKIESFIKDNDNYYFTFVNDGSSDSSREIIEKRINEIREKEEGKEEEAEEAGKEKNNEEKEEIEKINDGGKISLITYEKNRGKGHAVRTGFTESDADIVIFTDSDLAYGLLSVKRIAEELIYGNEQLCVGSRNINREGYGEYSLLRRIASKTYIKMLSVFGGLKLSDSQCGIKGYRNPWAKKIFSLCETDGFAFDYETILIAEKMGLTVKEIPVKIINHNEGNSKVRVISDSIKMLSDMRKIKKRVKKAKINKEKAKQ